MADVRSLLRQERDARQQDAPRRPTPACSSTTVPSKKRKADDEDTIVEVRKRNKPDEPKGLPADFDGSAAAEPHPTAAAKPKQPEAVPTPPPAHLVNDDEVDEDEWAAFQRDVATAPPEQTNNVSVLHALNGNATISAAPMTAAELAAQAKEEQSAQRGKRDAEVEAEKEDAARNLEEELDEMEELEERVRRLREKREAIRKARETSQSAATIPAEGRKTPEAEDPGEGSEDSSDEDDFDDWRFRPA